MSSLELSREFELHQKTCLEFKWKIQQAMQSSEPHLINCIIELTRQVFYFLCGTNTISEPLIRYFNLSVAANLSSTS